jgi:Family of unknown function (DUF6152)
MADSHVKKTGTPWIAALLAFASTGSLLAHHSLANYDTTKAVRVKGTIVEVHLINPHSFIFLDEKAQTGSRAAGPSKVPRFFSSVENGLRRTL